jgi:tetratricopeptide (TPR) repeat protein
VEFDLGRREEAERSLKRSVAILDKLTEGNSTNRELRTRHGFSLYAIGSINRWFGRNQEAEHLLCRSGDLFEELRLEGPLEPDFKDIPSACDAELGDLYTDLGRIPESEKAYTRAITRLETLVAEEPTNPGHRHKLARTLRRLPTFPRATRQLEMEEALARGRRCVALGELLVNEFPDIPAYWEHLQLYQQNLVIDLIAAGQDEEAEKVASRAVELAEKVVRDHPGVPEYLNSLTDWARTLAELYNSSPAGDRFHKPARALELARRAVELRPEDQWDLTMLGEAQYRTGDWKGCIETLMKAMAKNPEGGYGHWLFLAMACWQLGDKEQARSWLTRDEPGGFDAYEKHCEERIKQGTFVSPYGPWVRKVRAEAAALLGVQPPEGQVKPKPVPETVRPPK